MLSHAWRRSTETKRHSCKVTCECSYTWFRTRCFKTKFRCGVAVYVIKTKPLISLRTKENGRKMLPVVLRSAVCRHTNSKSLLGWCARNLGLSFQRFPEKLGCRRSWHYADWKERAKSFCLEVFRYNELNHSVTSWGTLNLKFFDEQASDTTPKRKLFFVSGEISSFLPRCSGVTKQFIQKQQIQTAA